MSSVVNIRENSVSAGVFPWTALGLFAGLYAAQAITGSLVQTGLPTVLRDSGVGLDKLGLLQLLFLPWALKFLWAPIVDRYSVARLGHRRAWLLACQSLIALGFFAMAWLSPFDHFSAMLVLLLAISFFAATQDISTDALAVEAIPETRRSLISGAAACGGYFGFLLGIGLWLPLYAAFGWQVAMLCTAAAVVVLTLPALFSHPLEAPVPQPKAGTRPGIKAAFANPSIRKGLLFLLVYQVGLRLGMALIGPYLVDAGLPLDSIGWLKGAGGAAAGLLAAILATVFMRHLGVKALIGAALFNALAFAGLALAAWLKLSGIIAPLILLQAAGASFSLMTMYAAMIGWCSPKQAGTDFSLLQSADAVLAIGVSIAAGFIGNALGHFANFALAAALLCVAAMLVARLIPTNIAPVGTPDAVHP